MEPPHRQHHKECKLHPLASSVEPAPLSAYTINSAYLVLVSLVLELEYGAVVWDPFLNDDIDRIERIQRLVVRFFTGDYNSTKSITPSTGSVSKILLLKTNLPLLQECQRHLCLALFYKVVEDLVLALPPENFLTHQRPDMSPETG